jgi:serine/threonine-protein kinase
LQACEAIAEAHAVGIIHRDLKPSNLFCVRRSDGLLSVKILDFGISKMTSPAVSRTELDVTRPQSVIGSPLYMSPEQMMCSKDIDARTDIWSLGVILFELVSNRAPFEAEETPALLMKVMTQPPQSLMVIAPAVPDEVEAVIRRCLEKEPAARFGSVAELAVALRPFAALRMSASVERIVRIVQTAGLGRVSEAPSAQAVVVGAGSVPPLAPTLESRLPAPGVAAAPSERQGAETTLPIAATQASWGQRSTGGDSAVAKKRSMPLVALGLALTVAACVAAVFVIRGAASRGGVVEAPAAASTPPVAAPLASPAAPAPPPVVPPAAASPPPPAPSMSEAAASTAPHAPPSAVRQQRTPHAAKPAQLPPASTPNVYDHM